MKFEDIKGLGKSRIAKLQEAGISQPLDLLLHFPYKYIDLKTFVDLSSLKDGDELVIYGIVLNQPKVQFLRKGLNIVKAQLKTRYGEIEVVWFNQRFVINTVKQRRKVWIIGKIKKFRDKITLNAPTILHPVGRPILPLYRSIPGVPQSVVYEAISTLLERAEIRGYLSDEMRIKHGLAPLNEVFRTVHCPTDIESAKNAARALALEKLSYMLASFAIVKKDRQNKKYTYSIGEEKLGTAIESLPFDLTDGQRRALDEITASLKGNKAMNRLLQGDVGCGKTVVALLAMYFAFCNGYQSVLMAPTEILAMQHYAAAIKILEPLGVRAALLCGSLSRAERENALFNIRNGLANVVIGTHALIGEDVEFANVSLIITDEQQRFGVNQRSGLENKTDGADTLVMTATPIPRTLALSMYGELEQSSIKTLPKGRPNISTALVPESKIEKMFAYVAEQAEKGEQTYIVCPRIDVDEDDPDLTSAVGLYDELCAKFPDCRIGLLHGKLKDIEKNDIMSKFRMGIIKVLVATTVIEVGIDVPNATNIVIFNGERYGLSQLHQLRGRVGRGEKESFCFLPTKSDADERLKFFCTCRDGFELSEYDFNQRGAGDFIGVRQHGNSDDLPVKIDTELIADAKKVSEEMLEDPNVNEQIRNSIAGGAEQYVRSVTMN